MSSNFIPWGQSGISAPVVPENALDTTVKTGAVNPNMDPAQSVLTRAEGLKKQQQHDAWDAYHAATDENELAEHLKTADLPQQVKHDLWEAKHTSGLVQGAAAAQLPPERNAIKNAGDQRSYVQIAAENSPSGADPHNATNPNLNAVPADQREELNNRLLPYAAAAAGGIPLAEAGGEALATQSWKPLEPIAKAAIRSYLGSKLGHYVGREAGGLVGHPEAGGTVGSIVGGVGGGLYQGKIPTTLHSLLEGVQGGEESAGLPTVEAPPIGRTPGIAAPNEIPSVGTTPSVPPPTAMPKVNSMDRLQELIRTEGAGTPPLKPNVPLGDQLFTPPGEGLAPRTVRANVPLAQTPEIGGGRITAPEKLPTVPQEEVGRQMGAPPLQENVPLKNQWKPMNAEEAAAAPPSKQATLEMKYPDKSVRQLVHALGEDAYEATGGNAKLQQDLHQLNNQDMAQAMMNAGEDMGTRRITASKFRAPGDLSKQEAISYLLKEKKLTIPQIIELAKQAVAK